MAWRGLHLSRAARLRIERGSLCIDFKDEAEPSSFRTPLEDLAWLVLDTPEIGLSSSFLSKCSEHEVLIVGVNDRHLPAWTSLPWTRFHRQGEVLALQLSATLPQKKRLWQEIVRRKIEAQATCLEILGRRKRMELSLLAGQVRSGDPDNVEARAAQLYWPAMFPDRKFVRHSEDLPNFMLDYGYAVIRAAIARHLSATGFIPQLGLHHASLANAYNLADDLIEPFRPFVDLAVAHRLSDRDSSDSFNVDDRRALVKTLDGEARINGETYTLFGATGVSVASLKQAISTADPSLLLFPELQP
jgi:CRISPR-associated protein Cas1